MPSLGPWKSCAKPGSTAGNEWKCSGPKTIRFVKENELWATVINQPVTSWLFTFNFTSIGNFPLSCFMWWNHYLEGRRFIRILLKVYSGRDSRKTVGTAAYFLSLSKRINNNWIPQPQAYGSRKAGWLISRLGQTISHNGISFCTAECGGKQRGHLIRYPMTRKPSTTHGVLPGKETCWTIKNRNTGSFPPPSSSWVQGTYREAGRAHAG